MSLVTSLCTNLRRLLYCVEVIQSQVLGQRRKHIWICDFSHLTFVMLNKLRCHATSNFQPVRLLFDRNSHIEWQTVQIQISWLLSKPTDLDFHRLLRQGMSCSAREGLSKCLFSYTEPPTVFRCHTRRQTCVVWFIAHVADKNLIEKKMAVIWKPANISLIMPI